MKDIINKKFKEKLTHLFLDFQKIMFRIQVWLKEFIEDNVSAFIFFKNDKIYELRALFAYRPFYLIFNIIAYTVLPFLFIVSFVWINPWDACGKDRIDIAKAYQKERREEWRGNMTELWIIYYRNYWDAGNLVPVPPLTGYRAWCHDFCEELWAKHTANLVMKIYKLSIEKGIDMRIYFERVLLDHYIIPPTSYILSIGDWYRLNLLFACFFFCVSIYMHIWHIIIRPPYFTFDFSEVFKENPVQFHGTNTKRRMVRQVNFFIDQFVYNFLIVIVIFLTTKYYFFPTVDSRIYNLYYKEQFLNYFKDWYYENYWYKPPVTQWPPPENIFFTFLKNLYNFYLEYNSFFFYFFFNNFYTLVSCFTYVTKEILIYFICEIYSNYLFIKIELWWAYRDFYWYYFQWYYPYCTLIWYSCLTLAWSIHVFYRIDEFNSYILKVLKYYNQEYAFKNFDNKRVERFILFYVSNWVLILIFFFISLMSLINNWDFFYKDFSNMFLFLEDWIKSLFK